MKTLTPSRFMTVGDKHYAQFALEDRELPSGATLLYTTLFKHAGQKDHCWPSQARLAALCKCSQRTVKAYLRQLIHLEYILVEKKGLHNIYHLLLTPRIQRLIDKSGLPLQPVGEKSAPIKGQKTSEVGENFAPRNKNKERRKTPIPQASFHAPTLPPSATLGVENSASKPKKENVYSASFERLFDAWPVKQDKLSCAKTYAQLAKAKRLPAIDVILTAIGRMKSEDRRWQAGYVPNLKFWLLGERWNDEPLQATSSTSTATTRATTCSGEASPSRNSAHTEGLQVALNHLQQAIAIPKKINELDSTVDALQELWPSQSRQRIFASIGLAKCRGLSLSALAQQASSYMGELKGSAPSMPLSDWIRGNCYAPC
ncbi:MAG: helix-turn-helix domain-containing protein [Pseudomonadota bacterium]